MGRKFKTSYQQDSALFQNLWVKSWLAIAIVVLCVLPFVLKPYELSIMNGIGIAVIGALGLNLLTGYTGQISLCHGALVGIGAYSTALLSANLGLHFLVSLPLSGLMAAALGLIVGVPSLRLKGLYLALGTLAFGFIFEYVILHWNLTQGEMGLAVPRIQFASFVVETERHFYFLILITAALATLAAKNIARSKIGRCFVAIRDRDIAAEAMGISLTKYKIMAFGISAFYAGLAGCLLAHYQQWIVPGNFDLMLSISYIAMIIMGGLGTVLGSILGAGLITLIPHGIVYLTDAFKDVWPGLSGLIVSFKLGVFGLVIVGTLLFEPRGLFGIYQRIKVYWKTWPFKY